jgi:hypothetical protein
MMKREKRHCRVAKNHPLTDLSAIEDDLLGYETNEDQRTLLRKMQKGQRLKSYVHFLLAWIVILIGLILPEEGLAQQSTNPYAAPFLNIPPALTPSGILHNRSPYYSKCFLPDSTFQIFTPNPDYPASPYLFEVGNITMQPGTFLKLYEDMLYAQIHDSVLINPEDYLNALIAAKHDYDVPISLMLVNFQRMHEDAILSGKVWFDTLSGTYGSFPDTLWIPDTIHAVDTLFVPDSVYCMAFRNGDSLLSLAFHDHTFYGMMLPEQFVFFDGTTGTVIFGIPEGLFVRNLDSLPTLSIDFDDGGGFRTVQWDSQVNITYSLTAIPKIHTKTIRVKMPFFNADLVLQSKIHLVVNAIRADTVINTNQIPFLCTPNTGSQPAEARISVLYSDRTQQKLIKPILFVEGFETALQPFGVVTFQNVMNGLLPELGFPEIGEMSLLFDSLIELGYDLVYLDFLNSRDSLECNMLAVVTVIQWVNEQLTINGSHEKLVVAGASMGGLLSRYALRQMELDGCCHNTRLYISFDAPHQGANIPLALQEMVNLAADQSEAWQGMAFPANFIFALEKIHVEINNPIIIMMKDKVLNSPAARAMLMLHTDPDAQAYHHAFFAKLGQMGYPQYCRRISLINGSENGVWHQLEDPQGRLFSTGEKRKLPHQWKLLSWGDNYYSIQHYAPRINKDFNFVYSEGWSENQPNYFSHNDWTQSLNSVNSMIHIVARRTNRIRIFGELALTIVGIPFAEAGIINTKESGNDDLDALFTNNVTISMQSAGLPPLTIAPGGLNDALKKLGDAATSDLKVHSNKFSFVPSISALDLKGEALEVDVKYKFMNGTLQINEFDAYWAPKRYDSLDLLENQMHVQVTYANRWWIIDHVLHDWALRTSTGRYAGVLNGYFNYGKPGDQQDIIYMNQPLSRILYSLEITQGGSLHVNRQGDIGSIGSMKLPKTMSTFRVDASGDPCDPAMVRVQGGGSLSLGDQANYNNGELVFHPGTLLELLPGSHLVLFHESRLLIENGATLIVHPGAIITLADPGSVLEIRGKLVLHDSAELTFSGQGFLRFSPNMSSATVAQHFVIGQGASLHLTGSGMEDKRMEIASNTWFPEELPVRITNAQMVIDEGVSLAHPGPLFLDHVWVRATDTTRYYGTFSVYGQPGMTIKNSCFSHGNIGLSANLTPGGTPLVIRDCEFRRNITGLWVADERMLLQRCLFHHNHSGVGAFRMSGQSRIEHCEFVSNISGGVYFSGQVTSGLKIASSSISGSYNGVEIYDGMLQAECSQFTGNTQAGIFAGKHSRIKLGNNSRNQIAGNLFGIALDHPMELDLLQGVNNFAGNAIFVVGEVSECVFVTDNPTQQLDFTGNHMPYYVNQLPVDIYYYDPVTGLPVQVGIALNTLASYSQTLCNGTTGLPNEHILAPVLSITGVSLITGGRFAAQTFAGALYQSANLVSCEEYTGNDTLAIACLNDILGNLPVQLSGSERDGVEYALFLMNEALGNAVALRQIDPNRALDGMMPDEYVAMVRDRVQQRLDAADTDPWSAEEEEARYALMLAQMYRVAEHYDYAMDLLSDHKIFEGTTVADDAIYWDCICRTERLMLLDSIDRTAYHNKVDSCSLHLQNARTGRVFPQVGWIALPEQMPLDPLVHQIYPNPAVRHLVVSLSRSVNQFAAELTDPAGRILFRFSKEWCGTEVPITLPDLTPGSYLLKVTGDGATSFHKVMIVQK